MYLLKITQKNNRLISPLDAFQHYDVFLTYSEMFKALQTDAEQTYILPTENTAKTKTLNEGLYV